MIEKNFGGVRMDGTNATIIGDGEGWFNSYYGQRVEGYFAGHVRMMLTGQVFSVMGGVATDEQIRTMTETVDKYLYAPKI